MAAISKATKEASFREFLQPGDRFAVRVRRVREFATDLSSMAIERLIGAAIQRAFGQVVVDLENPVKTFFGTLTEDRFLLGLKLAEVSPTPFRQRRPRQRAFFHPSAMPAKLARCMVNLARPRGKALLTDPFCGAGSFLIEAGLLGYQVLGLDAKRRMAQGCLRNLKGFNIECEGVIVADALNPPLKNVDRVVTDPPYGRSASTFGYTTRRIVEDFLAKWSATARKGQLICMASPRSVHIGEIAQAHKVKHIESHLFYEHRSLTREIVVLEKL
jgi:tRNA (guanine10-N2)-dimethyltransferase